jgi:hypothetical protein
MEFIKVYRVDHGDYMVIPKSVQEQYPKKFIAEEEKEEEEELQPVKKKGTKKV